jgi:putative membrane protein
MMDSGMMDGMGFGAGYGMFFGMFFWILLLVGIVALIVWAIQKLGGAQPAAVNETALDILKKRYASGEIEKAEFEEKKNLVS